MRRAAGSRASPSTTSTVLHHPSPSASSQLPHTRRELYERRHAELGNLPVRLPLFVENVRHLQSRAHVLGQIRVHGKLSLGLPAVHVGHAILGPRALQ